MPAFHVMTALGRQHEGMEAPLIRNAMPCGKESNFPRATPSMSLFHAASYALFRHRRSLFDTLHHR